MTPRPTPKIATWFLMQFYSNTENESVIGDLVEKYRRGQGPIWYWRQVLAIVFVGFYRELRRDKWRLLAALFRTWCIWGVLNLISAALLMWHYLELHPRNLPTDRVGMTVTGFPLLTLRIRTWGQLPEQWAVDLLSVILSVLTLVVLGRIIAASSRIHPRIVLLAYITSFVLANVGSIVSSLMMIFQNQPIAHGSLIRDLIGLPLAPALMILGAGLFKSKVDRRIGERGV